jgi:hypothetical protein
MGGTDFSTGGRPARARRALAAAAVLALTLPAVAGAAPRVTIALLADRPGPGALAAAGLAPGVLSAGLDSVSAA